MFIISTTDANQVVWRSMRALLIVLVSVGTTRVDRKYVLWLEKNEKKTQVFSEKMLFLSKGNIILLCYALSIDLNNE